jgi:hypothetical protein
MLDWRTLSSEGFHNIFDMVDPLFRLLEPAAIGVPAGDAAKRAAAAATVLIKIPRPVPFYPLLHRKMGIRLLYSVLRITLLSSSNL